MVPSTLAARELFYLPIWCSHRKQPVYELSKRNHKDYGIHDYVVCSSPLWHRLVGLGWRPIEIHNTGAICLDLLHASRCCCVATQNRQRVAPAIPIWLDYRDKSSTSPERTAAGEYSVLAPHSAEVSEVFTMRSPKTLFAMRYADNC